MKGKDGNMYKVVKIKGGKKRWQIIKKKEKRTKRGDDEDKWEREQAEEKADKRKPPTWKQERDNILDSFRKTLSRRHK